MKIAVIIARILLALPFLAGFPMFVTHHMPQPQLTGNAKLYMDGINATGYFLPLLLGTQFVCAVALLIGRFVALALVVIFPVVLNILLYHAFVDPAGLPLAILLMVLNLFLAYAYRGHYRTLVAAK